MKFVSYLDNGRSTLGAVIQNSVVDLSEVAPDLLTLIASGTAGLARARQLITTSPATIPLDSVTLQAPIPIPRRNVMCLGLNYAEHAEESLRTRGQEAALPQFPIIFTKATTAVTGPYDIIPFDENVSTAIDWEVELAIVIGKPGINLTPERAMSHVFGYTVINDITARDLQRQHKQFFKGKSLDGSCPIGPWVVTADQINEPHNLTITCRVNGEVKQQSRTSMMIFDIPTIVMHLSKGMTLLPGDIIATGTPAGVGFARTPPQFLKPGDVVECEIEHIGVIRNQISA